MAGLKFLKRKPRPVVDAGHAQTRDMNPFSFQVAHRRLAWMFRASVGLNFFMIVMLGLMVNAFSILLPMKEIRVALLRTDQADDRVYTVEPISQEVPGFQILLEAKSRRYVRNMLSIDVLTQERRFNEALPMTGREYYKEFERERLNSGDLQRDIDSGLNRSITVEAVSFLDRFQDNWNYSVDFIQTDERKGRVIETKKLRAFLKLTTRPNEVTEEEKYENPLGIRVLKMVLKQRDNL